MKIVIYIPDKIYRYIREYEGTVSDLTISEVSDFLRIFFNAVYLGTPDVKQAESENKE